MPKRTDTPGVTIVPGATITSPKRVLLASAAILRDLPSTVREHYADLLPEDVRQPG